MENDLLKSVIILKYGREAFRIDWEIYLPKSAGYIPMTFSWSRDIFSELLAAKGRSVNDP